eukprot:7617292-Pyramimonas_sp.AAC.1
MSPASARRVGARGTPDARARQLGAELNIARPASDLVDRFYCANMRLQGRRRGHCQRFRNRQPAPLAEASC